MEKKDEIFKSGEGTFDFAFTEEVAEVFDDMLVRSVPFYQEIQRMVVELGKTFIQPSTNMYDLGCSTGTTIVSLCREISDPSVRFIGIDNSEPMLKRVEERIKTELKNENRCELVNADLNNIFFFVNASVITSLWTLQFIRPLNREILLQRIYEGLNENGVFIACEKILVDSSDVNRIFIDLYYDMKHRQGYSEMEIRSKREALENVLVPYRDSENIELFRRSKFGIVEKFFQWYNFAGYIAIKKK